LLSNLRAKAVSSHNLLDNFPIPTLALEAVLPVLPPDLQEQITPAIADMFNQILSAAEAANFSNSTFVNDNGILARHSDMRDALQQSLISAFLIFGFPGDDRHGACLQAEKWDHSISHSMLYLGFFINSRNMTVSWSYYKRAKLYHKLQEILLQRANNVTILPRQMASVIGKSAISISPWGTYLSFSMSTHLTRASCNAFRATRSWWSKAKIQVNKSVIWDICLLMETLLAPKEDPIWTRPIALLVPREATHWFKSDVSYAGIGSWTLNFGALMWRVT
jgi:hypothetical protein